MAQSRRGTKAKAQPAAAAKRRSSASSPIFTPSSLGRKENGNGDGNGDDGTDSDPGMFVFVAFPPVICPSSLFFAYSRADSCLFAQV